MKIQKSMGINFLKGYNFMRKIFLFLFLFVIISKTSFCEILDFSSEKFKWKAEGTSAYSSVSTKDKDGKNINNNFIVNYDKKLNCIANFGFSIIEGENFGKLLKTTREVKGSYKMFVDGIMIFNDEIFFNEYENGIDFSYIANNKIINLLSTGKLLKINLYDEDTVIFNLKNAAAEIEKAKNYCE